MNNHALDERLRNFPVLQDDSDWADIVRRSEQGAAGPTAGRLQGPRAERRWRPLLIGAVAVAALICAGGAIADGLGAFNGLSQAQNAQSGAGVLDSKTAALIDEQNAGLPSGSQLPRVLPDTARILAQLPNYGSVYALTDTRGDLCIYYERVAADGCGAPLSATHPASTTEQDDTGSDPVAYGVVMDGITSVSFDAAGQDVTVPVTPNNTWFYSGDNTAQTQLTVHYANGSSQLLNDDCTMSLQQARSTECGRTH